MHSENSSDRIACLYGLSDLACERRRADLSVSGVEFKKSFDSGYLWERLRITSSEGAKSIGKPIGNYDTLTLTALSEFDDEEIEDAANEIAKELCLCFERIGTTPGRLLVAGLGNRDLTPDSIGPRAAEKIHATMHFKKFNPSLFDDSSYSEIAVCIPGVSAKTGLESSDILAAVCERIEPDAVIAIDSIASRSAKRLGNTIQICDTGISPGSGIGNRRRSLNYSILGAPVISIGVPTVISTRALTARNEYTDSVGLNDELEMFVSPKEIDVIAEVSSKIIASGINQAFGIF